MSVRLLSRRQLLIGSGGFALGLPLLRSLLPRDVRAQDMGAERRFVAFATDHGGVFETAMFPDEALLTREEALYSGHDIRHGSLVRSDLDGRAGVSTILTGPSDKMTDRIVERMNVLRGLDIPFYIAHHTGGHLGNFARNDGNGADGADAQMFSMPTIDQLLAWSPSFYSDLSAVKERSMVLGRRGRLSWNWSTPSTRSGTIQEVTGTDPLAMFERVFIPEADPSGPAPRPPVVDRVLESYQSLRESNARLSSEDRQRLDDHMDRLFELQRRLEAGSIRRASCGDAIRPGDDIESDPVTYYSAVNDVIVAAFLCGTSRIAVVKVKESEFVPYAGDWHQDVAHQWSSDEPQALLQEANQKAFEHAVLDLVDKLDVDDGQGGSILDSAIVQWTQESGEVTHESRSAPVVTFGGSAGTLKTGNYCDYRKLGPEGIVNRWSNDIGSSGLLYSQWLAQVMTSLGMGSSEFQDIEYNGAGGYGYDFIEESYEKVHSEGVVENASDPLPFLT